MRWTAGLSIVSDITFIDGTVYRAKSLEHVYDYERAALVATSMQTRTTSTMRAASPCSTRNSDPFTGKRLVEPYSDHEFVVQNPPAAPLDDRGDGRGVPACRTRARTTPMYEEAGGVPAHPRGEVQPDQQPRVLRRVRVLRAHVPSGAHRAGAQPRVASWRRRSRLTEDPDFKGYIHDVGGPTANFRAPACDKQLQSGACREQALPVRRSPARKPERPTIRDYLAPSARAARTAGREEGVRALAASASTTCWPTRSTGEAFLRRARARTM